VRRGHGAGRGQGARRLVPVCGKPMTLGVLHRVLELSDRDQPVRPEACPATPHLFPLAKSRARSWASAGHGQGQRAWTAVLSRFGSELTVLRETPVEDLARVNAVLAEAIGRMRRGRSFAIRASTASTAAFRSFRPRKNANCAPAVSWPCPRPPNPPPPPGIRPPGRTAGRTSPRTGPAGPVADGHPQCRTAAAATATDPHLLVIAGPGTGKTHTLMARITSLIAADTPPDAILAVTFTRRAAQELRDRLARTLGEGPRPGPIPSTPWPCPCGPKPVARNRCFCPRRRLGACLPPSIRT
jgi:hypothetical protein